MTDLPRGAPIVAEIVGRGGGNAFFLEELSVVDRPERLPGSVREIVHARTAGLSHDTTRVLSTAAVRNGPVDDDLLIEVSGLSVAEIGAAVQEAIDRRLLTYDGAAETYSLRHGLVREAIYEEMLPAERRRLHLGIAAHLERTADPNDAGVAAEIAHHCQRSGAHVRGLVASIRAAEAAERVVAHHEAVRHWVRAIDQLAVAALDAPPTVHRIDLLERGAAAANQAGDGERAVELQRAALEEPEAQTDRIRHATGLDHLARYLWNAAEDREALSVSDAAVRELEGLNGDAELAAALATRARMLMLDASFEPALRDARRALELDHDAEVDASAQITLGAALAGTGETDAGIAAMRNGLAAARGAHSPEQIARGLLNLDYAYWAAGRLREAGEAAVAAVDEVRHLGLQWAYGPTLLGNAADKLFLLGRWDEARVFLDEASPFVVGGMAGGDLRNVEADLAIGEGRFAEAAALLDDAFEMVRHVSSWNTLSPLWYSQLDLSIWRRDWERADAALAEGLAGIPDSDRMIYVPRMAALGMRLHAEVALVARASRDQEELSARLEAGRLLAAQLDELVRQRGAPRDPGPRAFIALARGRAVRACSERPRRRPGGQLPRRSTRWGWRQRLRTRGCARRKRTLPVELTALSRVTPFARPGRLRDGSVHGRCSTRSRRSLPARGSMLGPSPTP